MLEFSLTQTFIHKHYQTPNPQISKILIKRDQPI